MIMRYRAMALLLFVLSACGGPSVDSASDQAFTASIDAMKQALPEGQRRRFERALQGLEYLASENALSVLADSTRIKKRLRTQLGGMDAEEVIDLWKERLDDAITKLEEKRIYTETAMEALKAVQVKRARYYVQQGQSVVKLVVVNGTPHTLSRVFFHGKLISRGRRRPWVEDDFNYNVPGGLKPGQLATWNFALLSPAWAHAPKGRSDLRLKVTVTRVDGLDHQPIFDAHTVRFSRRDRKRLETLKSYLPESGEEHAGGGAS